MSSVALEVISLWHCAPKRDMSGVLVTSWTPDSARNMMSNSAGVGVSRSGGFGVTPHVGTEEALTGRSRRD